MDAARRVPAAMATQPRERFLPASERRRASDDGPLDIGHGQTNSQPRTVRAMLELLDVRPGQRVLDVGSGVGLDHGAARRQLVGPTGSVLGLERVPDWCSTGSANVEAARMPWAAVRASVAGVLGAPDEAPFDRVLVSAMAARLPEPLVAQLDVPGVLVVPVAGRMLRVERDASAPDGRWVTEHRPATDRFVPASPTDPGPPAGRRSVAGAGSASCSGRPAAPGLSPRRPCAGLQAR